MKLTRREAIKAGAVGAGAVVAAAVLPAAASMAKDRTIDLDVQWWTMRYPSLNFRYVGTLMEPDRMSMLVSEHRTHMILIFHDLARTERFERSDKFQSWEKASWQN